MVVAQPVKSILIVDDSPVDRLLIERLLQQQPEWNLTVTDCGRAALDLLQQHSFDLVITDLQMPDLDGIDLVRQAKQHWPNLPIVLVTGAGSEQAAIESLRSGAACYSPKNSLAKDLVRTVRYVLQVSDHVHFDSPRPRAATPFQSGFVLENDCRLIGPFIENVINHLPRWLDEQQLQIGMALGEALVNAMHHGNLEVASDLRTGDESAYYQSIRERRCQSPYADRRVQVEVQLNQQQMQITVTDEGPGFAPDLVPDPTAEENLEKLCGRGLLLIRSFMDEVEHRGCGNQIIMRKKRVTNELPVIPEASNAAR